MITDEDVARGLALLDGLDRIEQDAFLGLFYGARFPWTSFNGGQPFFGKPACGRVSDWRDFYLGRLPDAGLFRFTATDPRPALGMDPGTTFIEIDCGTTDLGWLVREAWLARKQGAASGAVEPAQIVAPGPIEA